MTKSGEKSKTWIYKKEKAIQKKVEYNSFFGVFLEKRLIYTIVIFFLYA